MLLDLLPDERAHQTEALSLLGVERLHLCVRRQQSRRRVGALFSKPRLMRSSRGSQMFSEDERALNVTSYSYDCFTGRRQIGHQASDGHFLRATISSMMRFWPSMTMFAPSGQSQLGSTTATHPSSSAAPPR